MDSQQPEYQVGLLTTIAETLHCNETNGRSEISSHWLISTTGMHDL